MRLDTIEHCADRVGAMFMAAGYWFASKPRQHDSPAAACPAEYLQARRTLIRYNNGLYDRFHR